MVYHERVLHNYFIPCYRKYSGQHNQYAQHKIGCDTVEYTTAFLYSDWLYFLSHGINANHAMLSSGIRWNIPRVTCMFLVCTREDTRENWDIACFTKSKRCVTILNNVIENSEANESNAVNDKDWLYTSHLMFS